MRGCWPSLSRQDRMRARGWVALHFFGSNAWLNKIHWATCKHPEPHFNHLPTLTALCTCCAPLLPLHCCLHCRLQRLELVARVQLAHYLDVCLSDVPACITKYTPTVVSDNAAACSVAGVKVVQGGRKMVSEAGYLGLCKCIQGSWCPLCSCYTLGTVY